jgi:DNA repair protein RecO (recombination protein O)
VNQILTRGIVLSRTDYGEADRILTLLTPDQGKIRLIAKGVRKIKSKLAGGIELFSVSDVTFIRGRGDIGTLVSARLDTHYGTIVKDIERVQLGYDLIKQINKSTEDQPEMDYFVLLEQGFAALNDTAIAPLLIRVWFQSQLLKLAGHSPNLTTDASGERLIATERYNFDFDTMAFTPLQAGKFSADHIKLLRLLFSGNEPQILNQINGIQGFVASLALLVQPMMVTHLRG